jgi:hypothetical protein
MTTRKYSSRSQQTTLTGALTSTATSATVVSGSALLGGATVSAGETYTVVIDPDTALEEIVDVTAVSTNTVIIVRGVETAGVGQAHSAGAIVRHMATGRDFREANTHIENTTTAHGITLANLVKTTDTGTVSTTMLAANAVTTAKITDLNVTTGKIADSAVTSAKIADLTIATGDIADLAISTGKIADSAITSAKIADGTIVAGDIADGAITSAKILDGTIVAGALADGAVTSAKILDGTIVNADINAAAAIAYAKLALTGAIVSADIANDSIMNADINTAADIVKTKILGTAVVLTDTGTITSTMIADGTIVNADINAAAAIALSKLATDPLARANHTGTQTASTVSNFDTQVRTNRLDQMAAPTAAVALNAQKITGLADPTGAQDAATKVYTDTQISNLIAAAPGALDTLNELAVALGNDAAFSTTVTNSIATKLALAGGTMSGAIAMGTSKITGLGTPTAGTDASTKDYADLKLALTGGTLSGSLAMGTNKITGLGTPTNAQDGVTKAYADSILVGAPGNLTGPITSVGAATSIASQTGTGTKFVVDTSPTLITPVLGVATATSINATSIPSTKTLVVTTDKLNVLAATTSAELAGMITNETGTGALVFGTAPTITGTMNVTGDINLSGVNAAGSLNDELALILMGAI